MILQGNQRGGARQMANHLLNKQDNEHVDVHEVSGFACNSVHGALQEIHAVSKGTKCNQFMFSLSLSPPRGAVVSNKEFEDALELVEKKLGLEGQPRVVVFHEKEGRRHAHCVWSRIQADASKAINLPHTKRKLQDVSRELYLQHGWEMPKGFIDPRYRDPRNFSYEEWQQAKRAGEDARICAAILRGIKRWVNPRFPQTRAKELPAPARKLAPPPPCPWRGRGDFNYQVRVASLCRRKKCAR